MNNVRSTGSLVVAFVPAAPLSGGIWILQLAAFRVE